MMRNYSAPAGMPLGSGLGRSHVVLGSLAVAAAIALAAIAISRPSPPDVVAHRHDQHVTMTAGSGASGAIARPVTVVRVLSCNPLPNVPGKSITTALVTYPPDAFTPAHRHPGSVMAFVVSGTLRSQLNGGPIDTFRAGEAWFEPPGTLHSFAENASTTEPASLLATFVADDNCGPLVIPEK